MSAEEFCIWLSGFVGAANSYNVTPKQWDDIKEKLESVFEFYSEEGGDENEETSIVHQSDDWYTSTTIPSFYDKIVVEYIEK
jgi:hypothetical protein